MGYSENLDLDIKEQKKQRCLCVNCSIKYIAELEAEIKRLKENFI